MLYTLAWLPDKLFLLFFISSFTSRCYPMLSLPVCNYFFLPRRTSQHGWTVWPSPWRRWFTFAMSWPRPTSRLCPSTSPSRRTWPRARSASCAWRLVSASSAPEDRIADFARERCARSVSQRWALDLGTDCSVWVRKYNCLFLFHVGKAVVYFHSH